jgi:hypothetical protein
MNDGTGFVDGCKHNAAFVHVLGIAFSIHCGAGLKLEQCLRHMAVEYFSQNKKTPRKARGVFLCKL